MSNRGLHQATANTGYYNKFKVSAIVSSRFTAFQAWQSLYSCSAYAYAYALRIAGIWRCHCSAHIVQCGEYSIENALVLLALYRCAHQTLEENIRDLHRDLQRQLGERQTDDSQLCILELSFTQS